MDADELNPGTATIDLDVDLDGPFTIAEIIEIEDMSGERVGPRSGRYLLAVALVVGRRTNPALTVADVDQIEVRVDG